LGPLLTNTQTAIKPLGPKGSFRWGPRSRSQPVPVFKGYRTPAKWELKLQDGNETDWETVTRDEYDSVEVGDHF
ncbi:hypothetical protein, partial [Streptomyces sp. NPDC097610]|uniref:hypothetical protein n=1 Tax=Streptomyces sp. NPDC097610 TaxID=3157227 RepID=UPI00332AD71D